MFPKGGLSTRGAESPARPWQRLAGRLLFENILNLGKNFLWPALAWKLYYWLSHQRHKDSFSKGKWKHKQHVASIMVMTMYLTGHTCSTVDTVLGSGVETVRGLSDSRGTL